MGGLKMKRDLKLNTEYPAPDEPEITEKLIALLKGIIEQRYFNGVTHRDVHVKGHAAVRAEFTVEPLAPELRVHLQGTANLSGVDPVLKLQPGSEDRYQGRYSRLCAKAHGR